MATRSTTSALASSAPLPPVKAEHDCTPKPPPPIPQSSGTTLIKKESQEFPITNNSSAETPENHQSQQEQIADFSNSLSELRNLSSSLSAFFRRYDELQEHVEFIRTTIDAALLRTLVAETSRPKPLAIVPAPAPAVSTVANSTNPEPKDSNNSSLSEIELLCRGTCGRSLRKYLVSHLSEVAKLREEVPAAMKLAPNPGRLVLSCIGKFFRQGRKAYSKNSLMIPGLRASMLIMEFFLLMEGNGIDLAAAVKKDAKLVAAEWRKRLKSEGGIAKAYELDARGLLLFVACFGLANEFKEQDIISLIQVSNAWEISEVLRRSSSLLARIPDIIEWMMIKNLVVDAVNTILTFGMEGRFPPYAMLISFLQDSEDTWKRLVEAAQGSLSSVNKANKDQLADLESVLKCLENHKIDPLKVLPGCKISEKIFSLEREIANLDSKHGGHWSTAKRKADEPAFSKKSKQTRFSEPHHHKAATAHVEFKDHSDGLAAFNSSNVRIPGDISSFPASSSSVFPRAGVRSFSGVGTTAYVEDKGHSHDLATFSSLNGGMPCHISSFPASSSSELLGAGVGSFLGVGPNVVRPAGSYAGVHGSTLVNQTGQVINENGQPYGWHADAGFRERLVAHSYAKPSGLGVNGLSRSGGLLLSLEGFPGLPDPAGVSKPRSSDLYQFADAVLESEASRVSRAGGSVPSIVPAHRSSYLC